MGVPVVGVVDIDVIKEGGTVWTSFLDSGFLPNISHEPLSRLRSALKTKFDGTGKDMKREGGINLLSGEDREAARNLFRQLEDYGLFVVEKGELESWLPQLNASGHGPNWLIETFEEMGEDPESADYVKPGDDDVWEFLSRIKLWCTNPDRKGIPT